MERARQGAHILYSTVHGRGFEWGALSPQRSQKLVPHRQILRKGTPNKRRNRVSELGGFIAPANVHMRAASVANHKPTALGTAASVVELEELLGDGLVSGVILAGGSGAVPYTSKNHFKIPRGRRGKPSSPMKVTVSHFWHLIGAPLASRLPKRTLHPLLEHFTRQSRSSLLLMNLLCSSALRKGSAREKGMAGVESQQLGGNFELPLLETRKRERRHSEQ